MGTTTGIEMPPTPRAENPQTTEDIERVKADYLQRAPLKAADYVTPNATALTRAAAAGITSLLATPAGDAFRGQSALINTALPPDEPQIGAVADERRGAMVLRTPVALHVSFSTNPGGGNAYPNSLMGVVAFVRQTFLDAQHYQAAQRFVDNTAAPPTRRLASRPAYEPALEALQPALARRMPVAFRGDTAREILRALDMAKAFKLETIVTGAREADQVATDLKSADARVIVGLDYPKRPTSLAPDADESLSTLRARANAPKTAAALAKAGVPFAFASGTLEDPRDFIKNAAKAVQSGLSARRCRQGADAAGGDHCRSSRPRGLARSREARQRARHRRRSLRRKDDGQARVCRGTCGQPRRRLGESAAAAVTSRTTKPATKTRRHEGLFRVSDLSELRVFRAFVAELLSLNRAAIAVPAAQLSGSR